MNERILRLKRWLHRTRLSETQFRDALMKKRRDELVRIAKGDCSAIKKDQLPDACDIRDARHPWSQQFVEENDYLLTLPLEGKYELILCGNKHEPHYRFAHGWICSDDDNPYWPYRVNPDCWLKFTGWPNEYLERLLTVLPDMAKEWIREDEYVTMEFVKIEKIRAIRQKVELLERLRETK